MRIHSLLVTCALVVVGILGFALRADAGGGRSGRTLAIVVTETPGPAAKDHTPRVLELQLAWGQPDGPPAEIVAASGAARWDARARSLGKSPLTLLSVDRRDASGGDLHLETAVALGADPVVVGAALQPDGSRLVVEASLR